jgi:eukaryotic-like serine/threonine-protein kinase
MELPAGHSVGPYEITTVLGAGGMGTVYLARDTRLGRKVALKFLHHDEAEPDTYARLLHEARAASTLNHPNICQVYDIGTEGEVSWIAMEYIEGQPLTASLSGSPLRTDVAVGIAKAVASGLAHAHARGLIHRDLKPANIVFDAEGQPKILDFGISSRSPTAIANDVTRTGIVNVDTALAGSLPYMAPEVLRGEVPDARSDLWSLGVTFYRMLTGKLPFGGSSVEIISGILDGRVRPLPSSVSEPVVRVVMRLLASERSARYASGAEVVAALDMVGADAPRAFSISRRAIVVAVTVLLAAAGYLLWTQLRSKTLALAEHSLVSVSDSNHRSPTFSPDATLMAVVVPDEKGIPQIRVINLAQKTSIPVTTAISPASRPRWSPKGDQIVYGIEGQGIWTVSPIGGEARRIIETGFNPNFSRDGTRLVYERQNGLWTAGADGSNPQRVQGSSILKYPLPRGPSFSPDGRDIAFFQTEAGPNGDVWIIPAAGGTPRRVTSDVREGGWPIWTKDGRSLVFSSARRQPDALAGTQGGRHAGIAHDRRRRRR